MPRGLLPGGVTLTAKEAEDTGNVQKLATRFAREKVKLWDIPAIAHAASLWRPWIGKRFSLVMPSPRPRKVTRPGADPVDRDLAL